MELDADTVERLAVDAVEVLRASEISPLLLLCEHAGAVIPEPWRNLGLPPAFLSTHYAYDPGVDGLTRALSEGLQAPAVLARYSRIFLDYNRFASDWDHMRPDLGGIPVPGNLDIMQEDRALRASIALQPLDRAIVPLLAGRKAVVSVHSFTPVMAGYHRPVDIGVLWREKDPFVRSVLEGLERRAPALGLRIGDNAPYDWREVEAYSLRTHGLDRGLPCFYLEVNNALFLQPERLPFLNMLLTEVLAEAIEGKAT
jgi:predicted N-formylglutamate amidohydrolase